MYQYFKHYQIMESSVKSMIRRSSNIEHSPHDVDDVYSKRRGGLRLGVGYMDTQSTNRLWSVAATYEK